MKHIDTLSLLLMLFVSQVMITIVHEIGHAVMAAIFTRKKVKVFFGSYGEVENSKHFKIGLFDLYVKKNIFNCKGGLCVTEGINTIYQNIIYVLAGTFFPVILGILLIMISKLIDGDYFYAFSWVFLFLSIISLIRNLSPRKKAVTLASGSRSPNDGFLLLRILRYKKVYPKYVNAVNLYNEKEYDEASKEFLFLINANLDEVHILRLFISSAMLSKNFELAKPVIEKYSDEEFDSTDYINFGYYYSNIDMHNEAVKYYHKAMEMNESWEALNNIGYSLIQLADYIKAIDYLNKAIVSKSHAYSYNNRGLAKIKLGNEADGLRDLEKGYLLDPANSYYFKNMGIYHFDRNEYSIALDYLKKAKEIDPDTYKIEEEIDKTKALL